MGQFTMGLGFNIGFNILDSWPHLNRGVCTSFDPHKTPLMHGMEWLSIGGGRKDVKDVHFGFGVFVKVAPHTILW
jgi:hypothetical protein